MLLHSKISHEKFIIQVFDWNLSGGNLGLKKSRWKNLPKKEARPLGSKVENAITEPKDLTVVQHSEVNPVDMTTPMTKIFEYLDI